LCAEVLQVEEIAEQLSCALSDALGCYEQQPFKMTFAGSNPLCPASHSGRSHFGGPSDSPRLTGVRGRDRFDPLALLLLFRGSKSASKLKSRDDSALGPSRVSGDELISDIVEVVADDPRLRTDS
jgi:hypothetical protein